ncbi:MAG: hypothetical protein AAF387_11455, partial [Pseudomonadota bacterium]
MKTGARGPFSRIRWFCKDGSIHPPKEYACKDLGGGVQHGEWSANTKSLRDDGYYIANVYADLNDKLVKKITIGDSAFAQMLIEQFLIAADDGWILRKARFYRGAFQDEDERAGARDLLKSLVKQDEWLQFRFLLLRSAARYLDHGAETSSVQEIRQLSAALSDDNSAFKPLRAKIHGRPSAEDAGAVREFVLTLPSEADADPYHRLADLIDDVYSQDLSAALSEIAKKNLPTEIQSLLSKAAGEL